MFKIINFNKQKLLIMFNAIISGHLTTDAKFNTHNENGVINFTVAVNFPTSKKDENGEYIEEVEYYRCSKWYKSTETPNILNYLKKGKKIIVQANKIHATHENKDGKDYVSLLVNVKDIELCGSPQKEDEK